MADPTEPQVSPDPPEVPKGETYYSSPQGRVFARDGQAYLRNQQGTIEMFDVAQAQEALAQGYQTATAQDVYAVDRKREVARFSQQEGALGSIKAFGESAARTVLDVPQAIVGVANAATGSDIQMPTGGDILGAIGGEEYAKNQRMRAEASPIASTLGSLVPEAAAMFATGGGASVLTASRQGGRALMGTLARNATLDGALGAAAGAHVEAEQAWRNSTPVDSQRLLAQMSTGAVLSTGLGAAGSAAGAMFSGTAKAVKAKAFEAVSDVSPKGVAAGAADAAQMFRGPVGRRASTLGVPPVDVWLRKASEFLPDSLTKRGAAAMDAADDLTARQAAETTAYEGLRTEVAGLERPVAKAAEREAKVKAKLDYFDEQAKVWSDQEYLRQSKTVERAQAAERRAAERLETFNQTSTEVSTRQWDEATVDIDKARAAAQESYARSSTVTKKAQSTYDAEVQAFTNLQRENELAYQAFKDRISRASGGEVPEATAQKVAGAVRGRDAEIVSELESLEKHLKKYQNKTDMASRQVRIDTKAKIKALEAERAGGPRASGLTDEAPAPAPIRSAELDDAAKAKLQSQLDEITDEWRDYKHRTDSEGKRLAADAKAKMATLKAQLAGGGTGVAPSPAGKAALSAEGAPATAPKVTAKRQPITDSDERLKAFRAEFESRMVEQQAKVSAAKRELAAAAEAEELARKESLKEVTGTKARRQERFEAERDSFVAKRNKYVDEANRLKVAREQAEALRAKQMELHERTIANKRQLLLDEHNRTVAERAALEEQINKARGAITETPEEMAARQAAEAEAAQAGVKSEGTAGLEQSVASKAFDLATGVTSRMLQTGGRHYGFIGLDAQARNRDNAQMALARAQDQTDRNITAAITHAATGAPGWQPVSGVGDFENFPGGQFQYPGESRREAFWNRTKEITELATNPELLMQRVSEGSAALSNFSPELSRDVVNSSIKAVQFMARFAQSSMSVPDPLQPHQTEAQVDDSSIVTFQNLWNAAMFPGVIMDELANWDVKEETVAALTEINPALLQDVRERAMMALYDGSIRPTYQQRMRLGVLLGKPEQTAAPDFQVRLQSYSASAQISDKPRAQKPGRPSGSPTFGQQFETLSTSAALSIGSQGGK